MTTAPGNVKALLRPIELERNRRELLEMARVRRSVWVAALVCGVLAASSVLFLSHPGREEEQRRGADLQENVGQLGEGNESSFASKQRETGKESRLVSWETLVWIPGTQNLELSREPRLGEIATATYTLTLHEDIYHIFGKERERIRQDPNGPKLARLYSQYLGWDENIPHHLKIEFHLTGVETVGGSKVIECDMVNGESRSFNIGLRFVSSPARINVTARLFFKHRQEGPHLFGGTDISRVIIDEETGQFGTVGEYLNRVEFRYNPGVADWEPEPHEGLGPKNREIIGAFRKLEPALTDSEALCLHYDFYNTPYLCWTPPEKGKEKLTDEDVARYLLNQGWLEKHREGGKAKEKWLKAVSEKNRKLQEKLRKKSKGSSHDSGSFIPRDSVVWNGPIRSVDWFSSVGLSCGRRRFECHPQDGHRKVTRTQPPCGQEALWGGSSPRSPETS